MGCSNAQHQGIPKPLQPQDRQPDADQLAAVVYFIDGRTASADEVQAFPRDSIADIEMLKGGIAVDRFGFVAYSGALVVTTTRARATDPWVKNIYYFIDGKSASRHGFEGLPRSRIAALEVVKGSKALIMYGPNSKDGVVLAFTKSDK
jgi:hypothetical protein